MKADLFNAWAYDYKQDATLEDFMIWSAGYESRNIEVYNLRAEIDRLQEILSEKAHG